MTRDSNWRDKVGADFKSPFYKVENWIRGYDDKSGNLAFLRNFRSGFVALKNRQTDSARERNVTLWGHNQIEMDFFCNSQMSSSGEKAFLRPSIDQRGDEPSLVSPFVSSPSPFSIADSGMMLSDYGMRVLGLNALLQKIDRVIRRHIGQSWVPQEVAEHKARKDVVTKQLEGLGCPLDELSLKDLQDEFCASFAERFNGDYDHYGEICLLDLLSQVAADCMLCGSSLDGLDESNGVADIFEIFEYCRKMQTEELQREFDDIQPEFSESAESTLMRIRIRQLLESNFSAAMDGPDVLPILKMIIQQEIREAILDAAEPSVRLARFSDSLLQPLIDSSMRILSNNMSKFKAKAKAVFQHSILESYRGDPSELENLRENVFGTLYLDIKRALQEVVFECLLIPCFVGNIPPFVLKAFEGLSEVPPEDCADDRAAFEQRLITIDEIIAELESIDETPPGPEDDQAEPEHAVPATKPTQTSTKSGWVGVYPNEANPSAKGKPKQKDQLMRQRLSVLKANGSNMTADSE